MPLSHPACTATPKPTILFIKISNGEFLKDLFKDTVLHSKHSIPENGWCQQGHEAYKFLYLLLSETLHQIVTDTDNKLPDGNVDKVNS